MIALLIEFAVIVLVAVVLLWLTPIAPAQEVHYNPGWKADEVRPLSLIRLKAMLRNVENTPWDFVGLSGERSSYQITEGVWKMWSMKPFWWASSRQPEHVKETERVVSYHLAYIKGQLEKDGYTQTPYAVAAIWKAGETRWAEHQLRPKDMDYATRAANLYADSP